MNEYKEVTAENLRFIRGAEGLNQNQIADLLGVEKHSISRIENGKRGLTDAEKHILDWYFFNKLPPRLSNPLDLQGCFEFSEAEWNLLTAIAKRCGQSTTQYIASRIREKIAEDQAGGRNGSRCWIY